MALRRVGYQMPMGSAGMMSAGKTNIGGIKVSPKSVMIGSVIFILLILIIGKLI
ncbi:hypothetical protein J7J26_02470 [Candidatus Micrarchaeota archaeon]|nr:hypothetical protein [Candidatus Micrarchaeota archaeon]